MEEEGKLLFLGEEWDYKIKLEKVRNSRLEIDYENKKLIFLIKNNKKEKIEEEIKNLLKGFLKKLIEKLIFHLEKILKKKNIKVVKVNKIRIKILKSRFGSCSSLRNLNFNLVLLAFRKELIYYVVVHEYCHLYHLNHSKEFWNLVYQLDKDFKKHRTELLENFKKLMKKENFWKKVY